MTTEAQSALRRIIEDFSERTRFVIICNYITRIIEPLTSRCVKFRFRPVPVEEQIAKLEEICQKEKITIGREIIESLLSQGDLRKSINSLQSLHNVNTVPEILPIPQQVCSKLFETLKYSNNLGEVLRQTNELLLQGWPADELLRAMLNESTTLGDNKKIAMIFEVLARADLNINRRGSQIQIIAAVSDIFYVLHS
jgi:replication factor C subunit 2/4